jgi:tol-pal system protein YbgF
MRAYRHPIVPALACTLAAAGLLCAPARASIFSDDEARKAILELRDTLTEYDHQQKERLDALTQRIDDLANRVEGLQHGMLEATDRTDAAKEEIAKIRGATEELHNEVLNEQKRERERYADLDARLHKLEPSEVSVDGKSVQVAREEQSAYDAAMAEFRANEFRSAIHGLEGFLARYPQSPYAPTAQYWLGSSYYAVKDFSAAVAAQSALVEHFPDSPHVPEALLNLAASQVELNDRKGARATLGRIVKDFPDSDQAKLAKDRLAALGGGARDKK